MNELLPDLADDAYMVITPFGGVQAFFDEGSSGIRLVGSADAVAHVKDVLSQVTGADGYMLSAECCSPNDFYRFAQPDWSGIKIDPPTDVALALYLEDPNLLLRPYAV